VRWTVKPRQLVPSLDRVGPCPFPRPSPASGGGGCPVSAASVTPDALSPGTRVGQGRRQRRARQPHARGRGQQVGERHGRHERDRGHLPSAAVPGAGLRRRRLPGNGNPAEDWSRPSGLRGARGGELEGAVEARSPVRGGIFAEPPLFPVGEDEEC
ncbi:unnamed protein product, partial [Ectocarpus sp. 4 AP-2014]